MKRSHQLLVALAALVAALVLFFWPRSAAAQARAEQSDAPHLFVSR